MEERQGCLSILVSLLISASNRKTIRGSGNVVEEDREVSGFTGLTLSGFGSLTIEVGEKESLRIEAEDNLMQYFETEVRNGMLGIGVQRNVSLKPSQPVRFYVTVRQLDTIVLSGSGKIEAPDLEAGRFRVTVSGSGNINMGVLNADTLDVRISGSGKLAIAGGQVEGQDITISGSGSYSAGSLRSESVKIGISGSGKATLCANESLDARISGSGSVGYYGSPEVSFSGSGSGRVKSLGNP